MGHALAAWPSVINHRNQIIAIQPNIPNKYPLYRVYMGLIITGPPSARVFPPFSAPKDLALKKIPGKPPKDTSASFNSKQPVFCFNGNVSIG